MFKNWTSVVSKMEKHSPFLSHQSSILYFSELREGQKATEIRLQNVVFPLSKLHLAYMKFLYMKKYSWKNLLSHVLLGIGEHTILMVLINPFAATTLNC